MFIIINRPFSIAMLNNKRVKADDFPQFLLVVNYRVDLDGIAVSAKTMMRLPWENIVDQSHMESE